MGFSSMFSSPSKQASAAASASGQEAQQVIGQLEQYTDQHQQQLRDAISGMGANPYFSAAQQLNPQAYYTNPSDTVTFGNAGGGGLSSGNPFVAPSQAGPPPLPGVILGAPPSAPPTSTPPVTKPPVTTPPNPTPIGGKNPFGGGQGPVVAPPAQIGHGGLLPNIPVRQPQ